MNSDDDPWKKLVAATKADQASQDVAEELPPPPTVSVTSLRERVHRLMLTLTWRKCSLLAASIAGLIFLVIYLMTQGDTSAPAIQIESPSPQLPAP